MAGAITAFLVTRFFGHLSFAAALLQGVLFLLLLAGLRLIWMHSLG